MKKKYVITNTPTRLPLVSTAVFAFMLDYYKCNDIWWGVFITFWSFIWIASIISIWEEVKIDLNSDEPKHEEVKNKFRDRIEKLMKERRI